MLKLWNNHWKWTLTDLEKKIVVGRQNMQVDYLVVDSYTCLSTSMAPTVIFFRTVQVLSIVKVGYQQIETTSVSVESTIGRYLWPSIGWAQTQSLLNSCRQLWVAIDNWVALSLVHMYQQSTMILQLSIILLHGQLKMLI